MNKEASSTSMSQTQWEARAYKVTGLRPLGSDCLTGEMVRHGHTARGLCHFCRSVSFTSFLPSSPTPTRRRPEGPSHRAAQTEAVTPFSSITAGPGHRRRAP
jgi:hypothetical protein